MSYKYKKLKRVSKTKRQKRGGSAAESVRSRHRSRSRHTSRSRSRNHSIESMSNLNDEDLDRYEKVFYSISNDEEVRKDIYKDILRSEEHLKTIDDTLSILIKSYRLEYESGELLNFVLSYTAVNWLLKNSQGMKTSYVPCDILKLYKFIGSKRPDIFKTILLRQYSNALTLSRALKNFPKSKSKTPITLFRGIRGTTVVPETNKPISYLMSTSFLEKSAKRFTGPGGTILKISLKSKELPYISEEGSEETEVLFPIGTTFIRTDSDGSQDDSFVETKDKYNYIYLKVLRYGNFEDETKPISEFIGIQRKKDGPVELNTLFERFFSESGNTNAGSVDSSQVTTYFELEQLQEVFNLSDKDVADLQENDYRLREDGYTHIDEYIHKNVLEELHESQEKIREIGESE